MNYSTTDEIARLREKKCFIFDLDGTLYLGKHLLPCAKELIHTLRTMDKRIIFFTNNSSRSHRVYVKHLSDMGLDPRDEEIVTSGDITIDFLRFHRQNQPVFLLGTEQLTEQFREGKIPLTDENGTGAAIVVLAFDTTLTYHKLDVASRLIRHGAEFLATHPDVNCPTEDDSIVDCGSMIAFLEASTHKSPTIFGKPYAYGVDYIEKHTGISRRDMLMVGDWIYTDIPFGNRNGLDSLLLMTGGTTEEIYHSVSDSIHPTFVLPGLSPLLALFQAADQ